jgi:predicted metal-dependent HD superfamily phosphohydrolase
MVEIAPISESDLPARFARLVTGAAARAVAARVVACYREPHRRYHTVEHLGEVLAVLDAAGATTLGAPVELAAWFHDAVYDPRAEAGANEQASADLSRALLGPVGVPDDTLSETARLILLTAGHTADPGDVPGRVLVDADLWILGSPAERYRRYATDVRAEYRHLTDAEWRAGRSRVLGALLARPVTAAARANMARELATLGGGEAQA